MSKLNLVIIGTGAYGTSISNMLIQNPNINLTMLGIDESEVKDINEKHINSKYFGSIKLDPKLKATTNMDEAIKDADIIFLVTPSDVIMKVVDQLIAKLDHPITWVNLAKGFDYKNNVLIAKELQKKIPSHLDKGICKIAGPTFAIEIVERAPSSFTIGCTKIETANYLQELFIVDKVVTETTNDIFGVEFVSVIKNSLAIFMGIIKGLELQTNGMALFLVLAIKEMQRFKKFLPSMKNETLLGFAGLGDLFLTGTSKKSRNFLTGFEIGKLNNVDLKKWSNTTIEGIRSINVLVELAEKHNIDLLLLPALKSIFDKKGKPKEIIENLIEHLEELDFKNIN